MLAGALTSSPSWLWWSVYWVAWAIGHAVAWWLTTATANLEAIAPLASVVYWLMVYGAAVTTGWSWKKVKNVYGLREAVDLGEDAARLGKLTRSIIRGQTRVRVTGWSLTLLVSGTALLGLLVLGVLGAWSLVVAVAAPSVWWVRRLNGERWE